MPMTSRQHGLELGFVFGSGNATHLPRRRGSSLDAVTCAALGYALDPSRPVLPDSSLSQVFTNWRRVREADAGSRVLDSFAAPKEPSARVARRLSQQGPVKTGGSRARGAAKSTEGSSFTWRTWAILCFESRHSSQGLPYLTSTRAGGKLSLNATPSRKFP